MERRRLHIDDFERLLKEGADQYRMYPSDRVWKGIFDAVQAKRRKAATAGAVILLLCGLFSAYIAMSPTVAFQQPTPANPEQSKPADTDNQLTARRNLARRTAPGNTRIAAADASQPVSSNESYDVYQAATNTPASPAAQAIRFSENKPQRITNTTTTAAQATTTNTDEAAELTTNNNSLRPNNTVSSAGLTAESGRPPATITDPTPSAETKNGITTVQSGKTTRPTLTPDQKNMAASIERLAQSKKKIGWQFYVSPSMSYRQLNDKSRKQRNFALNGNIPLAANNYGDIEDLVNQKPAVGFEMGMNGVYKISPNLMVKAGVQFNYLQYDINVHRYTNEKTAIALISRTGETDSLHTDSFLRSLNGFTSEWKSNHYLQISIPIGAELRLIGNERIGLHVGATLQPSYLIYNKTLQLTNDYKNYVEKPELLRKWNLNTSLETFFSYETKNGIRWQAGPNFRYQFMSSYIARYPIRENLTQFGFRFGFTKMLR